MRSVQWLRGVVSRMSAFVTCGATVPFPALVEAVLAPEFVGCLSQEGYRVLCVQFGRGYDFEAQFTSLTCTRMPLESAEVSELRQLVRDERVTVMGYKVQDVVVLGFAYSNNILQIIDRYGDVVISHAGTGSILDSLRLNKKLIVVVNHTLMDNHQKQIAEKFQNLGHILATNPTVIELCDAMKRLKHEDLIPLSSETNTEFMERLKSIAYS